MNTIPSDGNQVPRGYLSEEHKRKFTLTAGILGAAFFVMQFILPPMLMFAIMPGMMFFGDSWMKAAEPQRGVYWEKGIWYVETSFSPRSSPPTTSSVMAGSAELLAYGTAVRLRKKQY